MRYRPFIVLAIAAVLGLLLSCPFGFVWYLAAGGVLTAALFLGPLLLVQAPIYWLLTRGRKRRARLERRAAGEEPGR